MVRREGEREGGGGEMGEGGRDEEKGEKKENRYWKGMVEEERLNYFFMFSRHVFVIVYLVVIQLRSHCQDQLSKSLVVIIIL